MRTIFIRPAVLVALLAVCLVWSASAGAEEKAGWLGVSLQNLTSALREALDVTADEGVLVTEVVEDSPAEKAGIKEGDVIMEYDGAGVSSPHGLSKLVRKTEPGSKVTITAARKGKEKSFTVEIGERDLDEDKCMIKIRKDGKKKDFLLDLDEEAFLLGMHDLPGLLMGSDVWLGVQPIGLTDQLGEYFKVKDGDGVLIGEVIEDSPAQKAGLKAGDVIIRIGDERVEDTMDLHETLAEFEEGDEVTVAVIRDGKERSFSATLEESPQSGELSLSRTFNAFPQKMKCLRVEDPNNDLLDIYLEKELAEEDLEELEGRLEELEKELQQLREEVKKK